MRIRATGRPTFRNADGREQRHASYRGMLPATRVFNGDRHAMGLSRRKYAYLLRMVDELEAAGLPPIQARALAARKLETEGTIDVARIVADTTPGG